MPRPFSFGGVELDVNPATQTLRDAPEPETPFRIAIFGDFSGRANREIFAPESLAARRPVEVDRDNLDSVIARFNPALRIHFGGENGPYSTLQFKALDDFHPDQIYQHCEVFRKLRETRQRLSEPNSFHAAAAEMQAPSPPFMGISLDAMIEETESRRESADPFAAYLNAIVAPHTVPKPDPKQADLVSQVDAAIAGEMRALLHQPDFQDLEAAWRGAYFLVRTLETGTQLKIYLIDISKAEFAAGIAGLERFLVETGSDTPGEEPWALLAANYAFEPTIGDAELLRRISGIAYETGTPFLAAASPRMLGCESLDESPTPGEWKRPWDPEAAEAWQSLRRMPQASYLGLALPRFMLRPPYGAGINTIEEFDFEEMPPGIPPHAFYLWTNPMFACVFLAAMAFGEYGWEMRPGIFQEIEDMPTHFYKEDGETRMKPCAEALLTIDTAEKILDLGFMPLLSIKGRDAVRLARFQSIRKPAAPLAGRWG